jgi:hypothetical protein
MIPAVKVEHAIVREDRKINKTVAVMVNTDTSIISFLSPDVAILFMPGISSGETRYS